MAELATLSGLDMDVESDSNDEVEEVQDLDEEYFPVEYKISSYGADYPVDGLVKRLIDKAIYVPTFQRSYVWNIYRASRFVESLLLGLPVPAIFLYREERDASLLVIDGQQRLRSLEYFYRGVFEPTRQQFALRRVQGPYEGRTYSSLEPADRRRLDDSILHAIIVRQDDPAEIEPTSIYHIFERLNTGGVLLRPQEIRSCVFHGPFAELLKQLNEDAHWRALVGRVSSRLRDQELILRFLSLLDDRDHYQKPMKEFLNRFMKHHQHLSAEQALKFSEIFAATTEAIHSLLGDRALKPRRSVNAALADSLMVAMALRIRRGSVTDASAIQLAYRNLLDDQRFAVLINATTTEESNVRARLELATEALRSAP